MNGTLLYPGVLSLRLRMNLGRFSYPVKVLQYCPLGSHGPALSDDPTGHIRQYTEAFGMGKMSVDVTFS